jgi:hypothetical protein
VIPTSSPVPPATGSRRGVRARLRRATIHLVVAPAGRLCRIRRRTDHGQATAEYGLVILAAGGIALGVIAWASGTGSFTDLFDSVVDKLSDSL